MLLHHGDCVTINRFLYYTLIHCYKSTLPPFSQGVILMGKLKLSLFRKAKNEINTTLEKVDLDDINT